MTSVVALFGSKNQGRSGALLKSISGDTVVMEEAVMVVIRCRHKRWIADGGSNGGVVDVGMMVTAGSLLRRWRMVAKEMVGGGIVQSLMASIHATREVDAGVSAVTTGDKWGR
ncbi:hypothetical protein GW17_00058808 [Ensete ventricosum]|nr:hypothetical protein GW17_00058808 [Ensete ventricosum]